METQDAGHLAGGCDELSCREPRFLIEMFCQDCRGCGAFGPARGKLEQALGGLHLLCLIMEWLLSGSGRQVRSGHHCSREKLT